jgi:DNA-directed RNA polymerase
MTIAYGLTNRSAWKYMRDDGTVTKAWCPEEHIGIVSRHLGDLIMDSLKDTEVGLMKECFKGETYLKFLAKQCADAGMPMEWVTPSGFRVHQGYWNFPVIRMAVRLATSDKSTLKEMRKELVFQDNDVKIGVDDGASIRGVSPNVIHSLDADHCARSTVHMFNVGVEDFAHVHDSYGVPPSCVSLMHPIIREEFYEMHKDYQLETIKQDVEQLLGVSLPEPPVRGDLELSRVLDSTYFFH